MDMVTLHSNDLSSKKKMPLRL